MTKPLHQFPSMFVSSAEKQTHEWSLQYARAAFQQASDNESAFNYSARTDRYVNNRKWAAGLNDKDQFKPQITTGGDTTYLNMIWDTPTIIPKVVETTTDRILQTPYKPTAVPVDKTSLTEMDEKKREMEFKMRTRELDAAIKEKTGLSFTSDKEYIPSNNEELGIYMSSNFKQSEAIAMEKMIRLAFSKNKYYETEKKGVRDLVVNAIEAQRIYLDKNNKIKIRNVDVVNLLSSYVEQDDFSDARHIGEVITMTIDELRYQAGGQLTEEDLFEIAKDAAGNYNNQYWDFGYKRYYDLTVDERGTYGQFVVKVLDLEIYQSDIQTYVKKNLRNGGYDVKKRAIDYTVPEDARYIKQVYRKTVKNIYQVKWILGTEHVYDYGLQKNMLRKRLNGKYSGDIKPSFVVYAPNIYDMENKSITEQAIPFGQQISALFLKMQHWVMKTPPPGLAIDISALTGAIKGIGKKGMDPLEMRKIREQLGDIWYSSRREDGTDIPNTRPPIETVPSGLADNVNALIALIDKYIEWMKEVLGQNDAIDASQPDKKALVGVQKLAAAASKSTIQHLITAHEYIVTEVAERVCLYMQHLIDNNVDVEDYKMALGPETVKVLKLSELSKRDYHVSIEMLPDAQQQEIVRQDILEAVRTDQISIDQKVKVEQILQQSVDEAYRFLAYAVKQHRERKMQQAEHQSQMNAQAQVQATQAATQGKLAEFQAEEAMKRNLINLEYDRKERLSAQEHNQDMSKVALEEEYNTEQVEIAVQAKEERGSASAIGTPKLR